jgi:hypothetical protein
MIMRLLGRCAFAATGILFWIAMSVLLVLSSEVDEITLGIGASYSFDFEIQ